MEKSCKKGDNVIVKIHYSAISTACMRWVYYDRPCDLGKACASTRSEGVAP